MRRGNFSSSLLFCVAACLMASPSCARARTPLALDSLDPSHDGRQIAYYYLQEASIFRKKAEDVAEQAAAYERLFGRESEWAVGARLLADFYEDEAKERNRLAERYLGTATDRTSRASWIPR